MKAGGAAALLLILALVSCAGPKPPSPPPPAPPEPAPTAPAPLERTPAVPSPALSAPTAFLTGTVVYRQRTALTPEAEVQIELRDVSIPDVVSTPLAKQVISTPGQVPIPFSLEYEPARITPGHAYAISARITDRGQLQFVTEGRIPVLTGGAPGPVEILVVPVR